MCLESLEQKARGHGGWHGRPRHTHSCVMGVARRAHPCMGHPAAAATELLGSPNPRQQAHGPPVPPTQTPPGGPENPPGSLRTYPGHAPWVLSSSGSAATSPLTQISREKTQQQWWPPCLVLSCPLWPPPFPRTQSSSLLPPPRGSSGTWASLVCSLCVLQADFLTHDFPSPEWRQELPSSPSRGGGLCLSSKG